MPPGGNGGFQGGISAAEEPRDYELHQRGNAERFRDKMGADVRFVRTWDDWLIWTGTHWQRDLGRSIPRLMAEAIDASCREQHDRIFTDGNHKSPKIEAWRIKSQNTHDIKQSIAAATSIPELGIYAEDLDGDPWLFSAANGTIDLRNGKLRAHRRDDYITRCSRIHYDAEAYDTRWEDFVSEATGNDEPLMDYLQRAAGYSMTGSTREQCVFIVYGTGETGKGTFVSALQSIIGSYAAAVNFDIFLQNKSGKNWSLANLSQSRMVMCEESASGQRLADDVFKWLTGGTEIEIEAKFHQPFTYRPKFKVWLVTNNLPRTSDTDDAIWRRMW